MDNELFKNIYIEQKNNFMKNIYENEINKLSGELLTEWEEKCKIKEFNKEKYKIKEKEEKWYEFKKFWKLDDDKIFPNYNYFNKIKKEIVKLSEEYDEEFYEEEDFRMYGYFSIEEQYNVLQQIKKKHICK